MPRGIIYFGGHPPNPASLSFDLKSDFIETSLRPESKDSNQSRGPPRQITAKFAITRITLERTIRPTTPSPLSPEKTATAGKPSKNHDVRNDAIISLLYCGAKKSGRRFFVAFREIRNRRRKIDTLRPVPPSGRATARQPTPQVNSRSHEAIFTFPRVKA